MEAMEKGHDLVIGWSVAPWWAVVESRDAQTLLITQLDEPNVQAETFQNTASHDTALP